MFKLIAHTKTGKHEVKPIGDVYTVHENDIYQIEYRCEIEIQFKDVFIEDEIIKSELIDFLDKRTILSKPFKLFEDYFGFAVLSINGNEFNFNILIRKLKIHEIEEIVLYLFENNHMLLEKFISRSSLRGGDAYGGKDFTYSSKYINLIEKYCDTFEALFLHFKRMPYTVIRKIFSVGDYSSNTVDYKSIEWLFQNMDSVIFDPSLALHPDSFVIDNKSGIVEKIGREAYRKSYNNYENQVILGAFVYLRSSLSKMRTIVNKKIIEIKPKENLGAVNEYSDFKDIKLIPLLRLEFKLNQIDTSVSKLHLKYKILFKDTVVNNIYPKLTPVFAKFKHYQKAYDLIRKMRNLEYDLDGEVQMLNVRKLSELYEMYNLNYILQILQKKFGNDVLWDKQVFWSDGNICIDKVVFFNKTSNHKVTLFYEPSIKKYKSDLDLILIAATGVHTNASYCKPDYIIEVSKRESKQFCIIDSKYSNFKTVDSIYKGACMRKYIFDVGVDGDPYKKTNYLVLLHPDSNDPEINPFYVSGYFPVVRTMVSKPRNNYTFTQFIEDFISS